MSQASAAAVSGPLPPDYAADAANVQETLAPDTLRFAGRSIHSANSASANSGVYEINCQIDFLRETDRKVEFSRIDYNLKRRNPDSTAAPEIVVQPKLAFNLERPPLVVHDPFAYYLWPASRSVLGSIGVKFAKIGKSACKAWRIRRKPNTNGEYEPRELLFDVKPNNDVFDWLDGKGVRLAVEESKDDMYSLNILVPLERAVRDALVATWCIRLWERKSVQFHKKRTWKDRKHIIETCTRGLPAAGRFATPSKYLG